MVTQIQLGEITATVVLKDIKNIHLSVYPPNGRVHISAPLRMDLDTIRVYALSKLGWIRQQQRKLLAQARETPREYLERESHYVWGKRYLLNVAEGSQPVGVDLQHSQLVLHVRPGASAAQRQEVLENWYRQQLRQALNPLVAQWQERIGVQAAETRIKKMKTKWGTCNIEAARIWINLELVKKPPHCLEYIVVHELVHLIERHHNDRFKALMNLHLPHWQLLRAELNNEPLAHTEWIY